MRVTKPGIDKEVENWKAVCPACKLEAISSLDGLPGDGPRRYDNGVLKIHENCPYCNAMIVFKLIDEEKVEKTEVPSFKRDLTKYLSDNEKSIILVNDFGSMFRFYLCDKGKEAESICKFRKSKRYKDYLILRITPEDSILSGVKSFDAFENYKPEETIKPQFEKVKVFGFPSNGASSSCEIELEVKDISKIVIKHEDGLPLLPDIEVENIEGNFLFGDGTKEDIGTIMIDTIIRLRFKIYQDLQKSVLKELGYL